MKYKGPTVAQQDCVTFITIGFQRGLFKKMNAGVITGILIVYLLSSLS